LDNEAISHRSHWRKGGQGWETIKILPGLRSLSNSRTFFSIKNHTQISPHTTIFLNHKSESTEELYSERKQFSIIEAAQTNHTQQLAN